MINIGDKEITAAYLGNKALTAIYIGAKQVWSLISSCFGLGYWKGDEPWNGADAWNGSNDLGKKSFKEQDYGKEEN